MDGNGLEVLAREECVRLLQTVPIGRVITTMRALPVALPVNFVVAGDSIVFRSRPGSKLYAATRNAVVGFEADAFDPDTRSGWSVLVVGGASEVTAPEELALLHLPDPWAPGLFPNLIRIAMVQVTGRRVRPAHDLTAPLRGDRQA